MLVLFALAYLAFLVPFGHRTLVEHFGRILATKPAEELRGELAAARGRLETKVREKLVAPSGATP